jgi:anti-anti-sigma factor
MSTTISKNGDVLVVTPAGHCDSNSAPETETRILQAIEEGMVKVIVDFAQTDYVSSAGLRVLLKTAKLVRPKGGTVLLCGANQQIQEVLEISGLLKMIRHFASLEQATAEATG